MRLGNKDLQVPGGPMEEGGVAAASYQCPDDYDGAGMAPMPMGGGGDGYSTMPTNYLAGVTAPQYGMPICGTPIGLPGPPSVPMGVPAGLQRHVIKNHTRVHLPNPTDKMKVNVRQVPGYSYPKPVDHVRIVERTRPGIGWFKQPLSDRREQVKPNCAEAYQVMEDYPME